LSSRFSASASNGSWTAGKTARSLRPSTGNIDNPLYSTLQNQAIHNVKSDDDDKPIEYTGEQLIEINTQNWEIHTTGSESVLTGFPCLSDWWDTPIHIHDSIHQPLQVLLDGDTDRSSCDTTNTSSSLQLKRGVPGAGVGRGGVWHSLEIAQ